MTTTTTTTDPTYPWCTCGTGSDSPCPLHAVRCDNPEVEHPGFPCRHPEPTPAEQFRRALATALDYAADLNRRFGDEHHEYTVDPTGRKFLRVVVTSYGQRSVHAFVEVATLGLFKAEGWKRPARGVRFDLSTEAGYTEAVEAADRFGSYLYR